MSGKKQKKKVHKKAKEAREAKEVKEVKEEAKEPGVSRPVVEYYLGKSKEERGSRKDEEVIVNTYSLPDLDICPASPHTYT